MVIPSQNSYDIRTFTSKENYIRSPVSKILCYTWTFCYFYIRLNALLYECYYSKGHLTTVETFDPESQDWKLTDLVAKPQFGYGLAATSVPRNLIP